MNLKKLRDEELNLKVKNLAVEERKLTKDILLHIAEVDQRRLFLRMAYPSLFEYLTKEIGYSAGAAHRRIDAARLIRNVPEVSSKIEDGKINLSQISKLQQICRQIKKDQGQKVEASRQKIVLEKIEQKSSYQTDLILAEEFQIEAKKQDKLSYQKDESVRIEMTFSKAEMDLLQKAQQILSHQTGGGLKETILQMASKIVKKSTSTVEVKQSKSVTKTSTSNLDNSVGSNLNLDSDSASNSGSNLILDSGSGSNSGSNSNSGLNSNSVLSSSLDSGLKSKLISKLSPNPKLSANLKKQILQKDQCCQFKDIKTGRVCNSKFFLEVDHIKPLYQGGENNSENLRVLCKNHNQFRYKQML